MTDTPTYYISEASLGDEATETDARRMVEILSTWGYNVAYGDRHNDPNDIYAPTDDDWNRALDVLSAEIHVNTDTHRGRES